MKFKAHKVDVRGLSRKQAAKKRNYEYRRWKLSCELREVYKEEISISEKGYHKKKCKISSIPVLIKDCKSTNHRPRRNYWGNLKEDDTYKDEYHFPLENDFEDDHSGFYDNDLLWK